MSIRIVSFRRVKVVVNDILVGLVLIINILITNSGFTSMIRDSYSMRPVGRSESWGTGVAGSKVRPSSCRLNNTSWRDRPNASHTQDFTGRASVVQFMSVKAPTVTVMFNILYSSSSHRLGSRGEKLGPGTVPQGPGISKTLLLLYSLKVVRPLGPRLGEVSVIRYLSILSRS